jgi:hypothetical protein
MYRVIVAVMVVEVTVCDALTTQLNPAPESIVVPEVTPAPLSVCPTWMVPDVIADTVSVVPEIEPVNTAPGAPVAIRIAKRAWLDTPPAVVVRVQSALVTDWLTEPAIASSTSCVKEEFTAEPHVFVSSPVTGSTSPSSVVYEDATF